VSAEMIRSGAFLMLLGYFKKVAIADTAAMRVDDIFADPASQSSWLLLKGIYLFSIQIYGDFSGYSNIARGVSKLFGIELRENFQTPYLSADITEFWRRWHVTLSSWLRDYLYISLGGNRRGTLKTYRNLALTMLIGGLWHGASWTFVVWGGLHGIYLAVHRFMREHRGRNSKPPSEAVSRVRQLIGIVLTFHLVSITWVFFRASDFTLAFEYIAGLFAFRGAFEPASIALPFVLMAVLLPFELAQWRSFDVLRVQAWPLVFRATSYAAMVLAIVVFGHNEVPFIYFQF